MDFLFGYVIICLKEIQYANQLTSIEVSYCTNFKLKIQLISQLIKFTGLGTVDFQ